MKSSMRCWFIGIAVLLLAVQPGRALAQPLEYSLFEVGQVRPLALSRSGGWLYAVNTPDDRLEILRIRAGIPTLVGSVPVGMRPVSVAVRNHHEVWVVNHLSDSVSIVDTSNPARPRVVRTLWVGDDPRDIVFAGPHASRAFITTAHRGQNLPFDPELDTPGIGRADVWVFDAEDPGSGAGGTPLTIISLFADTPRALAVSPDGSRVYAAPFASGNRTTSVSDFVLEDRTETNTEGEVQRQTALIAKFDNDTWTSSLGEDVSHVVNFTLPDYDVFTIDAMAEVPEEIHGASTTFPGVGTTLFNMAVNPRTGAIYVSNTDANNITRFEGPGTDPENNSTVRGNIAKSRITVISDGQVRPIHLNKHIDYTRCCGPTGSEEARRSLADPRGMVISENGKTLYVAAHGSSKIGVFDVAELEADTFVPDEASHITLAGGGPTGLVLDETRDRLYVLTRFDNSIAVIDTGRRREIASVALHSPEPDSVVQGRRFLYDALYTSSHGDSSCASCHIEGHTDQLGWDLGDPTAPQPRIVGTANGIGDAQFSPGSESFALGLPTCEFDPPEVNLCVPEPVFYHASLKGPMFTQTLRGLDNHGPMHWRGDRTGGTPEEPGHQPDIGMFDERAAFRAFNVAFTGLIGRDEPLPAADMDAFTEFVLQIMLPPNPVRNLDNSLTEQQARGSELYFGGPDGSRFVDVFRSCNGCHTLDPLGNAEHGVARPGFFGTSGRLAFTNANVIVKVPQLRTTYDKIGMFGTASTVFDPFTPVFGPGFTYHGEQIRGFGFNHNGAVATVVDNISALGFLNLGPVAPMLGAPPNPGGFIPYVAPGSYPEDPALLPPGLEFLALFNDEMFHTEVGMQEKRDVEAFVFAYDTNFLPVVGQQLSLGAHAGPDARARLDLFLEQARVFEPRRACDLVAHDEDRGYLYDPASDSFSSSAGQTGLDLRALLPRKSGRRATLTFTCVPPGEGVRRGLDRDLDGVWDTVEEQKGSDPADRSSVPRRRSMPSPAESQETWWRAWSELRSWLKPVWSDLAD